MIGPLWCEEKKCWIRFTKNTTGFFAEVATQDLFNSNVTKDWEPTNEDYWQVQYKENDEQPIKESYRLLDGKLYRTTFIIHQITKALNVNTYTLEGLPVAFNGMNPFQDKKPQEISTTPFQQLPLTPEMRKVRDEAKKAERLQSWIKWKNRKLTDKLPLEQLSTFTLKESQAILNNLLKKLDELSAAKYPSPELYQSALIKAISDKTNHFYQIMVEFGNTNIEASLNPDDSNAAIEAVEISQRHVAFAFAVLNEELKQLNAAFGLATPVNTPLLLTPASSESESYDSEPLLPRAPLCSAPPNEHPPILISIHGVTINVAPPSKVLTGSLKSGQKSSPSAIARDIEQAIPLHSKLLIDAVTAAVKKYKEWYQNGAHSRGTHGWFTWLRHGKTGQNRADLFLENIEKSSEAAEEMINDYLTKSDTRYHRHSFSSFLLDELRKEDIQPWASLYNNPHGFYDQQEIIEFINNDKNSNLSLSSS